MWKEVVGFNGFYEVNEEGQVRSTDRYIRNNMQGGMRLLKSKIMSPKTKSNGYKEYNLSLGDQKSKMMYAHRIVATAFIGDIPEGYNINHKDGNKANNHVDNLEIVTFSENMKHAVKLGLHKPNIMMGEDSPRTKLTNDMVFEIRRKYKELRSIVKLVPLFPLSTKTAIAKICYNESWKHLLTS